MEIKRKVYIQELVDRKHNGMIKVITGIRRCGKSYLLFKLFYNHLLKEKVGKKQVVKIELDQIENIRYRNPFELDNFIKSKITESKKMHYVFIDEIQFVESVENEYAQNGKKITFYDILNGLLSYENVDIYVTGSNSKMLSKDVLTEFRGRGDEVHVFPLSFSEFMSAYKGNKFDGWLDYVTYGGLPAIMERKTESQKIAYLKNLFSETYIKDIIERNKIRNNEVMEDVLNVLASSIGSLTNPTRLANTFKSQKKIQISKNTIDSYITCFEDSFLISKAIRYNVKGRKYINTPLKYYFADVGLRNARLNFRQQEENHLMENIVYNELLYRGFAVDVGVIEVNELQQDSTYQKKQLEIDFIATQGSKKLYIQCALTLDSEKKTEQEKKSLNSIDDSFKKIIVTKDSIKPYQDEKGTMILNLYDFLLEASYSY